MSTKNIYNGSGQLIEVDTYDNNGNLIQRAVSVYNNGINTEDDIYSVNNGTSTLTSKEVFTAYNAKGNPTAASVYDGNNNLTNTIKLIYDSTGTIVTEIDNYNTAGYLTTRTFFDANENITEKDYLDGNKVLTQKDIYTNGILTESDTYNLNGSALMAKFFYDTSGNEIEYDFYGGDGTNTIYWKTLNTYTNGVLTESDVYNRYNGVLVSYTKELWNTAGQQTEYDTYTNGILTSKNTSTYVNGVITEADFYNLVNGALAITSKTINNYTNGILTKTDNYSVTNGVSTLIGDTIMKYTNGILTEVDSYTVNNGISAINEKTLFNSSGAITEQDYYTVNNGVSAIKSQIINDYTNGIITETDDSIYNTNGNVQLKEVTLNNTSGVIQEIDVYNSQAQLTEKNFYT